MPQKPLSYCTNFPRCKKKTSSGRCSSCRSAVERQRGSAAKRGYDRAWQKIAAGYLERHPVCERPDCLKLATDVNHKDGRGPRGDNSDENLEALCHGHHSEETVRSHGGFGRGVRYNEIRCMQGHARTPENTRIDKRGRRACRICERDRNKRYRARKAASS